MLRSCLLLGPILGALLLAGCTVDGPQPAITTPKSLADEDCMAQVRTNLTAPPSEPTRGAGTVTLLTHDSFNVPRELLAQFTNETGYEVSVVAMGDAGEALSKTLLQKDAPVGDVLFGVDNALVHRARQHDLFQPYASPRLAGVPDTLAAPFCADGRMLATPVDHGYVQLNHDLAWFESRRLALPADLRDVANATYAPLTVVQNPYTSSPGFAFLLATVHRFGETGEYTYESWWRDFARNGGRVVAGWEQAYGDEFTQGWTEGAARDRPLVVSYSTSPAYAPMNGWGDATTATLDLPGAAWLQVEAAGILRNAKNPEGARALVDFMLAPAFQEAAAFHMVVYPVHEDAQAPEAYARHAPTPEEPATLPPEEIDAKRDAWLQAWRRAVGQA